MSLCKCRLDMVSPSSGQSTSHSGIALFTQKEIVFFPDTEVRLHLNGEGGFGTYSLDALVNSLAFRLDLIYKQSIGPPAGKEPCVPVEREEVSRDVDAISLFQTTKLNLNKMLNQLQCELRRLNSSGQISTPDLTQMGNALSSSAEDIRKTLSAVLSKLCPKEEIPGKSSASPSLLRKTIPLDELLEKHYGPSGTM